jgi:hypothetical protein
VSAVVRQRLDGPVCRLRSVPGALVVGVVLVLAALVHVDYAFATQSKEQCRKCCEGKGDDEYFVEQCKLKCFRDPNHCVGRTAETKPAPARSPAPEEGEAKHHTRRAEFKWPQPLNLVPGREWEAAGEILSMNGIPPQHPNAAKALEAVERILGDFVRTHPSGGRLPTEQIERVIRQYR